jgi:hypothetical protein
MAWGGSTTATADDRQQQAGSQPPSAPQPRVGRSGRPTGLQQQQRTPAAPPTVSLSARHAFSLYCECVAAGQWARFTIEQRPEGELFNISARPWAAAPAAARTRERRTRRRRPNRRRVEKKQLWQQSRGSLSAAAAPRVLQQPLPPAEAVAAASRTYAQAAASPPSPVWTVAAATAAATQTGSRVPPLRLTKAARRRQQSSPLEMASPAFAQMDGADATPPFSSPEPLSPEAVPQPAAAALPAQPTASAQQRPHLQDDPPEADPAHNATSEFPRPADREPVNPPPPPPWSDRLPKYWEQVICHLCLERTHGYRRFRSCQPCWEKNNSN